MATLTQNILVPTDFSPSAMLAIEATKILAEQNDAKVTLVHVHSHSGVLFGGEGALEPGHSIDQDTEAKYHAELKKILSERLPNVTKAKTVVIVSPSPWQGIVDYAKKEGVDMIVMATHGRTGLKQMLIGSVAERVVRHAECPVLTLRSRIEE